jgi:mRNA-degrading endonuclease RelE of RelBE toxin-antitoxin system
VRTAYTIRWDEGVKRDMKERLRLSVFVIKRIVDAVDEQLSHEPERPTSHKKTMRPEKLPFAHLEPVWQLSVGEYRVFYDVAEDVVSIRAIRRKPGHKTTKEIL